MDDAESLFPLGQEDIRGWPRRLGSRVGAEEDQAGNGGAGAQGGQLSLGLRVRRGCHGPSLGDLVAPPHALCLDLFHISHPELRPFACISPQKAGKMM